MKRAALAVPLAFVIASGVIAAGPVPIAPVPQAAFRPVRTDHLAEPRAASRVVIVPPILEPRRDNRTIKPPTPVEAKPKVVEVTPKPRPVPLDRTPKARYGVVEGSRIARAYARSRLSLAQYHCLDELWVHESGWRWNAENRYSGAYGIPQALPGSKMRSMGADWRTNPVTQVRWGLGYIHGRYGTACEAWVHFKRNGWY